MTGVISTSNLAGCQHMVSHTNKGNRFETVLLLPAVYLTGMPSFCRTSAVLLVLAAS